MLCWLAKKTLVVGLTLLWLEAAPAILFLLAMYWIFKRRK